MILRYAQYKSNAERENRALDTQNINKQNHNSHSVEYQSSPMLTTIEIVGSISGRNHSI